MVPFRLWLESGTLPFLLTSHWLKLVKWPNSMLLGWRNIFAFSDQGHKVGGNEELKDNLP